MTITLQNALEIANKNPAHYKVVDTYGKRGFKNVIRNTIEANGKYTSRIQTFDRKGKLVSTYRMVNDNYSIYSNPTNGLLGLKYYTKIEAPNSIRLNEVYVNTKPECIGDVRAFYESQVHNMK